MTQQHRFLTALKRLQDWHADSVKARDYNSPAASSSKPGAVVLRSQEYPGTARFLEDWSRAHTDERREAIILHLDIEYQALSCRPPTEQYRDHWGKTRYRRVEVPA